MSGIGSSAGTAPSALAISVGGPPSTRIFKPFMSSSVFTCFLEVIRKLGDVVCSTSGWIVAVLLLDRGIFLVQLPQHLAALLRRLDRQERQRHHVRQRRLLGPIALHAPADIGDAAADALPHVDALDQGLRREHLDLDAALGGLLDLLHPGIKRVRRTPAGRRVLVGEGELDLLRRRRHRECDSGGDNAGRR